LLAAAVFCGAAMNVPAADSLKQTTPPAFQGMVDAKGQPYAGTAFADAKIYVLYFSASWCPDCRAFSPKFVKFIRENSAANPHMATVMINDDEDPAKMLAYMQSENMPFPSIPLAAVRTNAALKAYAGKYIPQVVVLDSNGKVLASNFENDVYVEPDKTLEALSKILSSGAAK
jgi:thiol-disulfide isomerase/thioredoxin